MALRKGWLGRQFSHVTNDVQAWPEWMKREAGFGEHRRVRQPEGTQEASSREETRPEKTATTRPANEG
jgi:hypothetical protein